jgi:hypothetical protein
MRIRIQKDKKTHKKGKERKFVLWIAGCSLLASGLEASPEAWASFSRPRD